MSNTPYIRLNDIDPGSLNWWYTRLVTGFEDALVRTDPDDPASNFIQVDFEPYIDSLAPIVKTAQENLEIALKKYDVASVASIFLETALDKDQLEARGLTEDLVKSYAEDVLTFAETKNLHFPILTELATKAKDGIPQKQSWTLAMLTRAVEDAEEADDDAGDEVTTEYDSLVIQVATTCSLEELRALEELARKSVTNHVEDEDGDSSDVLIFLERVITSRMSELKVATLTMQDALNLQQQHSVLLKELVTSREDQVKLADTLLAALIEVRSSLITNIK